MGFETQIPGIFFLFLKLYYLLLNILQHDVSRCTTTTPSTPKRSCRGWFAFENAFTLRTPTYVAPTPLTCCFTDVDVKLRVLYLYRTRPYMVIILRVFWLVTPKMPVTPVILLHNLYSSRHWQPTLFVLIVQVLNSASTTATTSHVDTSPPSTTTTTAHSKSPRTTIHPRYCFFFL
jgi:hypothetical protein